MADPARVGQSETSIRCECGFDDPADCGRDFDCRFPHGSASPVGQSERRTPPQIVAEDDKPAVALAAFVGQELEAAGFEVRPSSDDPQRIFIMFGQKWLDVRITGMWA